jgi:uncharacterized membrane protein YiaA
MKTIKDFDRAVLVSTVLAIFGAVIYLIGYYHGSL